MNQTLIHDEMNVSLCVRAAHVRVCVSKVIKSTLLSQNFPYSLRVWVYNYICKLRGGISKI